MNTDLVTAGFDLTDEELLRFPGGGTETFPKQEELQTSSAWDTSKQCEQNRCVAKTKKQRGRKKSRKSRGQGDSPALPPV